MTLVSVVIPTYNRAELLMTRALPSVLVQTHAELDIHVVGDGTDQATVDAMATVTDSRVRFTNLPHSDYPTDPYQRWCAMGIPPINHGLYTALGEWVQILADDDAYPPNRTARLLALAMRTRSDMAYGRSRFLGRRQGVFGGLPRRNGQYMTDGAYILRASLGYRYDPDSWRRRLISDCDLRRRLFRDRVRMAYTPEIVYLYWPATVFEAEPCASTS
jgi:glycosyltransferase involved in cell wall biosynthesis